jgi:serine/threonine protein kinase
MPPALSTDSTSSSDRLPNSVKYSVLGTLSDDGRAEVLLALFEQAEAVSRPVVIKKFWSAASGTASQRALEKQQAQLKRELAFLAQLEHENIARALSVGQEAERPFLVSEYLDGTSLASFLRWASWAGEHVPSTAVVRIILALLDAVSHAHARAESDASRALVNQPIATADVFITYDGSVKLLGFKNGCAPISSPSGEIEAIAIDALLSRRLTPELSAFLLRLSQSTRVPMTERWEESSELLHDWQCSDLGSDGRTELAASMSGMRPQARAEHAARLRAAFSRGRAEGAPAAAPGDVAEDVPPVSGYRLRSDIPE